ncbi:hypothetical protein C8Q76DRAFT_576083, partial [Earliella scabrosa]
LLRIFHATILHPDTCDYSVSAGPRSPWVVSQNTRMAAVLVCRSWYGPASEALYHEVVFRRVGQICALARTLRATDVVYAQNPKNFIRSIRLESLVYLPACEDIAKKDLAFILQHCTSLTSFTFRPHHTLQPPDTTNEALNSQQWYDCDWIWDVAEGTPGAVLASRCVSTLRELDLQHELDLSKLTRIHDMLSVQPRLTTLILGPGVLDNTESSNLKSLSRIVLPHLEELQV